MLYNTYTQYIFDVTQDTYPVHVKCYPRHIPSTHSMLPKIYTQYIYVYIHPYMLGNMYMYWVYTLGNINIYIGYMYYVTYIYIGDMYWVSRICIGCGCPIYMSNTHSTSLNIYTQYISLLSIIYEQVFSKTYNVPQYI